MTTREGTGLRILALDLATRTGFAHSAGLSGTWDLSVRRDESSGMRLVRLRGKLEEIRHNLGVDLVVFEAARHSAPGMQGALVSGAEMQGVLKAWCEEHTIEYRGYSPGEIKKHATGKGNADKGTMYACAVNRFRDRRVGSADEADALWLLSLSQRDLNGDATNATG